MKIITAFLLDYGAGKATDLLLDSFKKNVIDRWSKWRAKKFLDTFYNEISLLMDCNNSKKLNTIIDSILQDETRSEVLFEAYRRVSLSRSKNIGPRIIAVITAQIIHEERFAKDSEEVILSAAESLNDDELRSFSCFVSEHREKTNGKSEALFLDDSENLKVRWHKETIDSNLHQKTEISVSPLNLTSDLGMWAPKLKDLGIIQDEVMEKTYKYEEDSERHIDQAGQVREITWWIMINKEFFLLSDLINRFSDMAE